MSLTDFYNPKDDADTTLFFKQNGTKSMIGYHKDKPDLVEITVQELKEKGYTKFARGVELECIVRRNGVVVAVLNNFMFASALIDIMMLEDQVNPYKFTKEGDINWNIEVNGWGKVLKYRMEFEKKWQYGKVISHDFSKTTWIEPQHFTVLREEKEKSNKSPDLSVTNSNAKESKTIHS